MSRLVVISPHLDDAVFSCGTLIAAHAIDPEPPLVVTVFAGIPARGVLTALDGAAGFPSSEIAVQARRVEDIRACTMLGAESLHLDVLDAQYNGPATGLDGKQRRQACWIALEPILRTGDITIVAPLGIRHVDHQHVAAVCKGFAAWWYEELPYRVLWSSHAGAARGVREELPVVLPSCAAKDRAIRCYASQLGDGPPGPELAEDEIYHRA